MSSNNPVLTERKWAWKKLANKCYAWLLVVKSFEKTNQNFQLPPCLTFLKRRGICFRIHCCSVFFLLTIFMTFFPVFSLIFRNASVLFETNNFILINLKAPCTKNEPDSNTEMSHYFSGYKNELIFVGKLRKDKVSASIKTITSKL